jgi:hypothetical protein
VSSETVRNAQGKLSEEMVMDIMRPIRYLAGD